MYGQEPDTCCCSVRTLDPLRRLRGGFKGVLRVVSRGEDGDAEDLQELGVLSWLLSGGIR